jgi:hypothetical protein
MKIKRSKKGIGLYDEGGEVGLGLVEREPEDESWLHLQGRKLKATGKRFGKAYDTVVNDPMSVVKAVPSAIVSMADSLKPAPYDQEFNPENYGKVTNIAKDVMLGGIGLSKMGLGPIARAGEEVLGMGVGKKITPPKENIQTVLDSNFESGRVVGNEMVSIDTLKGGVGRETGDLKRVSDLAAKINGPDGYIERLIVDQDGNVVEGQHRLDALRQLGVKDVPIKRVADNFAGLDMPKIRDAVKAAGPIHSDNVMRVIRNITENLREVGTPEKVREIYDLTSHEAAALDAMSPPGLGPIARAGEEVLGPEVGVKINSPKIIEGDYFPDPDTHRGRMAIQGGALGAKPNIDRIIRTLENHGMDWKYSENGGITAYAEVVGPNGKVFKEGKHFNEKTSLRTLRNWLGYASGGPVHGIGLVKRNG